VDGAQAAAAQWAETFKDFPPVQKPNSFTLDDALRMMHETDAGCTERRRSASERQALGLPPVALDAERSGAALRPKIRGAGKKAGRKSSRA